MTVQEQIDALKATITGSPTRTNIYDLLEILKDTDQPEKDGYIVSFLDFFPEVKTQILGDLLSYPNYVRKSEET